jgi:hypothetical protein
LGNAPKSSVGKNRWAVGSRDTLRIPERPMGKPPLITSPNMGKVEDHQGQFCSSSSNIPPQLPHCVFEFGRCQPTMVGKSSQEIPLQPIRAPFRRHSLNHTHTAELIAAVQLKTHLRNDDDSSENESRLSVASNWTDNSTWGKVPKKFPCSLFELHSADVV